MKRILTLALVAITAAACEKSPVSLTVSPDAISFAADETAPKTVAVTTEAREWKATPDADWISVVQSGAALSVSVSGPYVGTIPREGVITVTATGTEPATVTVTQQATQSLAAGDKDVVFDAGETGSKTVTITTNHADGWKASSSADWLEVTSSSDGKLVLTVADKWYGDAPRTAEVTLTAGNAKPVKLTVTQMVSKNTLALSHASLTFAAAETGSQTVTVTTDAADSWKASWTADWINITGSASDKMVVTVTSAWTGGTARSARVTLTAGNADPKTLAVTQSAAPKNSLSLSDDALSYAASETGQRSVVVTTDAASWTASESVSWLTTSKNGSSLTVNVTSANTDAAPRQGVITVSAGNAEPVTLTVTQAGDTFVFSDIKSGTYTATGTPSIWPSESARSWSGYITAVPSEQCWELTNFGGDGVTVLLKFVDGKIYLDGPTIIAENDDYYGYLRVATQYGDSYTAGGAAYMYEVKYDKATRTLDFGGSVTFTNPAVTGTALVGVIAVNKSTDVWERYFTDMYSGLKLKLTFSTYRSAVPAPAAVTVPAPRRPADGTRLSIAR